MVVIGAIAGLAGACTEAQQVTGYPDQYAGVGLELEVKNDKVKVVKPIKGGPSAEAGIKAGDEIVAINGKPTTGMSLGEVVMRLRGRPGSQLTLSVMRQGAKVFVVLRRSQIKKTGGGYVAQEKKPQR